MSLQDKLNPDSPLSDLAAAIRGLNQSIQEYQRNALRTALDLGEVLSWARARVAVRGWKDWRAANCPVISKRWDELCRQFAANRPIIERALADNLDLTVRGAIKLISKPKASASVKPRPKPSEKWRELSADEKRQGLAADSIDAFLEYMPPDWRNKLADRVARIKHKTAKDRAFSARLREHLEQNPDDRLARYVRDQAIDPKHIVVHVGAIDAPGKRRPALADGPVPAPSTAVH